MFDMGFAEMIIIGIVALIVIGPERLPSVASSAGKWYSKIRGFVSHVKSDIESEFKTDELQKILQLQQNELQSLKESMSGSQESSNSSINDEINRIKKDVQS